MKIFLFHHKITNFRLFHGMINDQQELIFDCSFENEMTWRENNQTAKELSQCFYRIRDHHTPFIMHLYNLSPKVMSTSSIPLLTFVTIQANCTIKHHGSEISPDNTIFCHERAHLYVICNISASFFRSNQNSI